MADMTVTEDSLAWAYHLVRQRYPDGTFFCGADLDEGPCSCRLDMRDVIETLLRGPSNPAVASPPPVSAALDVEKVHALFVEMWHESEHPGDGIPQSCVACLRKADELIEYARLSHQSEDA